MADLYLWKCSPSGIMSAYEWVSVAIQGGGALILFAYTIFTARQVRALRVSNETNRLALEETRKSNETAARALILDRRAWLNLAIGGTPITLGRGVPPIEIHITNIGSMPATKIEFGHAFQLAPSEHLEYSPPILVAPTSPIGAKDGLVIYLDLAAELGEQAASALRDVGSRKLVLHVVCEIRYDDGFGNLHVIDCAWHLTGRSLDEWRFTDGRNHRHELPPGALLV